MIVLLDTSVLIDALHSRLTRRAMLAALVKSGHHLATSTMNIAEVYAGMRPEEEQKTEAFLSHLDCYPITTAIARRAGSLKYANARLGRTFALADRIVAATALEHGLTVLTDNLTDFAITGLALYPLS